MDGGKSRLPARTLLSVLLGVSEAFFSLLGGDTKAFSCSLMQSVLSVLGRELSEDTADTEVPWLSCFILGMEPLGGLASDNDDTPAPKEGADAPVYLDMAVSTVFEPIVLEPMVFESSVLDPDSIVAAQPLVPRLSDSIVVANEWE